MTAGDALRCQPAPTQRPVVRERLRGVRRARRMKTAMTAEHRAQRVTIGRYDGDQHLGGIASERHHDEKFCSRRRLDRLLGADTAEEQRLDLIARDRRVARRFDQPHDAIVSRDPVLLESERFADQAADAVSRHCARRQPLRNDQRDSRTGGRVGEPIQVEPVGARDPSGPQYRGDRCRAETLVATQTRAARACRQTTPSRARPFARRARITARPPRLRIRTRKPCVRLRRTTEGWNVRFIDLSLG